MRLSTIQFLGFRVPDGVMKLGGDRPTKTVLIEGPNGSGKTALFELLVECLQVAIGGSGSPRFARPPLERARATLEAVLSTEEAERMGAEARASFECFFGPRAMFDAKLDPDPATLVVREWHGRRMLALRLEESARSPLSDGPGLLLDVAAGVGDVAASKREAVVEGLASLGIEVTGLAREGGQLVPAMVLRGERRSLGELSRGQQAAVDVVLAAAACEHRYLFLDCVDGQLDREMAESTLRAAEHAFGGWQLFIATRHRGLELADATRIQFKSQGA